MSGDGEEKNSSKNCRSSKEIVKAKPLTKKKVSEKAALASAINMTRIAHCRNCDLDCPVKELNLSRDPNHKCTMPSHRYYARKYNVKAILTKQVLKQKYSNILLEVERLIKVNQQFMDDTDDRHLETYTKQLAFYAKLMTDAANVFDEEEEIGATNTSSIVDNGRKLLKLIYSVIDEELDEKQAPALIAAIHKKMKQEDKMNG